jgi:phosphohistidine swiveling domain-containing protein
MSGMSLVKYIDRNFSLLDHSFLMEMVQDANKGTPFWIGRMADVYQEGIMAIYVNPEYVSEGKKYSQKLFEEENDLVQTIVDKIAQWKSELIPCLELLKRIEISSNKEEIIGLLKEVISRQIVFGKYVELTHHLGRSDIILSKKEEELLGKTHDSRRCIFESLLKELTIACQHIVDLFIDKTVNACNITIVEYVQFLEGKMNASDLREFAFDREGKFIYTWNDGIIKTIGKSGFDLEWKNVQDILIAEEDTGLKGFAVNQLSVEGEVAIIKHNTPVQDIPSGKILVLAMTLPKMTPALKYAKGIITNEGGRLCHAAVVAREFNIACLVGTRNATSVLKEGDFVKIDASAGVVRKINS